MAKAELKTKPTSGNVEKFLNSISNDQRRKDCQTVAKMMGKITKDKPKMWGSSIVGFGLTHLKYASGRELDWMKIGFSPRKQSITLYVLNGSKKQAALLKKLGKHKTGKGCLYINSLDDVDQKILEQVIKEASLNSYYS